MSEFDDESAAEAGPELSIRIVTKVARALDVDPVDLPPLSDTVDVDALAILVRDADTQVEFDYAGTHVHVDADAGVAVRRN